jgi:hypothetical protein
MEQLEQENRLVIDYTAQFDEYKMRCAVVEDEAMALSRFRRGLNDNLRELFLRGITTLNQVYTLVHDY